MARARRCELRRVGVRQAPQPLAFRRPRPDAVHARDVAAHTGSAATSTIRTTPSSARPTTCTRMARHALPGARCTPITRRPHTWMPSSGTRAASGPIAGRSTSSTAGRSSCGRPPATTASRGPTSGPENHLERGSPPGFDVNVNPPSMLGARARMFLSPWPAALVLAVEARRRRRGSTTNRSPPRSADRHLARAWRSRACGRSRAPPGRCGRPRSARRARAGSPGRSRARPRARRRPSGSRRSAGAPRRTAPCRAADESARIANRASCWRRGRRLLEPRDRLLRRARRSRASTRASRRRRGTARGRRGSRARRARAPRRPRARTRRTDRAPDADERGRRTRAAAGSRPARRSGSPSSGAKTSGATAKSISVEPSASQRSRSSPRSRKRSAEADDRDEVEQRLRGERAVRSGGSRPCRRIERGSAAPSERTQPDQRQRRATRPTWRSTSARRRATRRVRARTARAAISAKPSSAPTTPAQRSARCRAVPPRTGAIAKTRATTATRRRSRRRGEVEPAPFDREPDAGEHRDEPRRRARQRRRSTSRSCGRS